MLDSGAYVLIFPKGVDYFKAATCVRMAVAAHMPEAPPYNRSLVQVPRRSEQLTPYTRHVYEKGVDVEFSERINRAVPRQVYV